MKTTKIIAALALLGIITWSCTTQTDLSSSALKSNINSNAATLTTAVNTITASAGYQVLANSSSTSGPSLVNEMGEMPVDTTTVSYSLTDVSGVWDYTASLKSHRFQPITNFFTKTGTSNNLILRMPESKVKKPWTLMFYQSSDTTLTNNYVIDVSKYARKYNQYRIGRWYWTYDLASNISISNVSAGDLTIQSSNQATTGYNFASGFTFANGYKATTTYTSGDTIVSTYNISKDNTTLYEEKYTAAKTSATSKFRERQYSITIGNVKIVRTPGLNVLDSAKIYVGGVLQTNAKIQVVDQTVSSDSTEVTMTNHKRDLQITFDDGTVTRVSQLLTDNTLSNIRTLFNTIRQAYFATNIVDNVANYIYKNKK
jgi:hypothetical protein